MSKSITKTLLHEVTVVSGVHQKYRSKVVLTKLLELRELQKVSEQLRQKSDVMLISVPLQIARNSVSRSKGGSFRCR